MSDRDKPHSGRATRAAANQSGQAARPAKARPANTARSTRAPQSTGSARKAQTRRKPRRTATANPQLGLDLKERHGHGGRRPGAGRKPSVRSPTPHRRRPALSRHHPVHVTMRTQPGTWNLRTKRCFVPIHQALSAAAKQNPDCRIIHFSVQGNHLHLIVEAEHARALTAGIKGLAVRMARRLNRVMGRRGRVFERYHAEALTTPRRVRNALSYVLNNLRRHAAQWGERPAEAWTDPFSSARWFDGWREPEAKRVAYATGPPWIMALPAPVYEARTWLVRTGWRRRGLVSMAEVPGAHGPAR